MLIKSFSLAHHSTHAGFWPILVVCLYLIIKLALKYDVLFIRHLQSVKYAAKLFSYIILILYSAIDLIRIGGKLKSAKYSFVRRFHVIIDNRHDEQNLSKQLERTSQIQ